MVSDGGVDDVDLAGMRAVLVSRYHDDEPRSPWTFALYVDASGDEQQRQAMADILTGRLGGDPCKQFPWVFKPADLIGVEAVEVEIDHTPGRGWFRAGGNVEVVGDVLSSRPLRLRGDVRLLVGLARRLTGGRALRENRGTGSVFAL